MPLAEKQCPILARRFLWAERHGTLASESKGYRGYILDPHGSSESILLHQEVDHGLFFGRIEVLLASGFVLERLSSPRTVLQGRAWDCAMICKGAEGSSHAAGRPSASTSVARSGMSGTVSAVGRMQKGNKEEPSVPQGSHCRHDQTSATAMSHQDASGIHDWPLPALKLCSVMQYPIGIEIMLR